MATVYLKTRKLKEKGCYKYYLLIYNGEHAARRLKTETLDIRVDKKTMTKDQIDQLAKLAKSAKAARQIQLDTGAHEQLLDTSKRKGGDFIAFWDNHIANYSNKDIRMYKHALSHFKQYSRKDSIAFGKLDTAMCEGFANYLQRHENLSGETPSNYFRRFKVIIKAAIKAKILTTNPASEITIETTDSELKKEVLTLEELSLLYDTPCGNREVKRAFLFSCFTGLGYAEIKALEWRHVSKGWRMKIARRKTMYRSNPAYIDIQLADTAKELAGERGKNNELVFNLINRNTGRHYTEQAVRKVLFNWVERAGIDKHITYYCSRHTFGVLAARTKANAFVLSRLMGHKSNKHTARYLNYIDELKDEAISKLPKL